jgi:hypothetical protein
VIGNDLATLADRSAAAFVEGRLLEILLPRGGVVAVLEAYLDASKSKGDVYAVAGFAFDVPQAKKFGRQFRSLFAPYGGHCHMTDLHNRKGAFDGIDDDEPDRLTTEAIKIINKRSLVGVAVGCDLREIVPLLPKRIDGFSHPYPFCCHMAMMQLGQLVHTVRPGEKIAYIFECGDEYQAEAGRWISNALSMPMLRDLYAYASHAFVQKKDSSALEGADILAWEYSRYWELTVLKRKIKMRRSLIAILTSGYETLDFKKRYGINFFTGPLLWDALAWIKAIGMME